MSYDDVDPAGPVIGGLAAAMTFVIVWIAAIGSVGWVFGIALGWVPAWLAAAVAYAFFRVLWPLPLLGLLGLLGLLALIVVGVGS
jgi:hypothetical protein